MSDYEDAAARKREAMQVLRIVGLFQSYKPISLGLERLERGRQRSAGIDGNLLDGVSRDSSVGLNVATGDNTFYSTTTGDTDYS